MDAEVPHAKIDILIGDNLHQSVLAKAEGLTRRKLHPMPTGKDFGGRFDYVFLSLAAAKEADLEAGDDAEAGADIGTDDDVAAVR